jgi:hypothetical protein
MGERATVRFGRARVIGALLLGAAAAGAAIACFVLVNYSARVPLRAQSLQAQMPTDLPVQVEVIQAGGLDGDGGEGVPVRLKETLQLQAEFDAMVPLAMNVQYRGTIPVKADVPVRTEVKTRVLGIPMTLPIEATFPLDLTLPINLEIPVKQAVRVKFSGPVSARVDQVVRIPLRAQLETRIRFTDAMIPITVRQADLEVPLSALSLSGPALLGDGTWTFGPVADAPSGGRSAP